MIESTVGPLIESTVGPLIESTVGPLIESTVGPPIVEAFLSLGALSFISVIFALTIFDILKKGD